ncbi:MAG: TolC family protein [Verrucomicrobia bacterium]|nr:TolC family protein [Verrucomicrobiota bacterium]
MSLRRSWRTLPIVAVFCAQSLAGAEPTDVAGTFPEDLLPPLKPILETALRQSFQVVAKQIELEQSAARVYVANALRLPSLSGNMSFARNQTAISSDTSTSTSDSGIFYSFGMNQPIYHWGALKAEGDKARIGVLIAEKNYREASRLLAVALRRSYLELVVKKMALTQMRYARKLLTDDLTLAREKLASGTLASGEIGGRELNLRDFELRTRRAEIELAGLRHSFSRIAGIPDLTEDEIPGEIPKPNYSAETTSALLFSFVRDGGRGTAQAEVAALKVKEADLNIKIANTRLRPKLNAGASYSLDNTTNASANSVSQQAVARQTLALSAQWYIFDGLATKGVKKEALAAKRANELQLQNISEVTVDAAQTLAQQLGLDAEEMAMADIRFGLSAGAVVRLETELKLGNVAQTAIDNAKSSKMASDVGSASARAVYLSRWTEFASLVGSDPVFNQLPARHDREKR